MLTKEQVAVYLRRPLTASEDANFDTYLDIATHRLSNLVCFSFDKTTGTRTFNSRAGYRTLFIDPFTAVSLVKIDGREFSTYVKKQNDSYQGTWFNSLEFDEDLCGHRVEVTATWGLGEDLPSDLAELLAGLFGIHETEVNMVKSKKIEDFSVTYKDGSELDTLVAAHLGTIQKYALCAGAVSHGLSRPVYHY
jgi:hypothetical protein